MPKTLQYSDSPNVETAFAVDSETGKKNRVVLTAAQDTSTLELSDNPNSTKGYVTVDGKKHRVILTADLLGEGGGGTIDTSKVVNADVLPVASADNAGKVYLYKGATDANYTHGYIYECTKESTYTDSVTFQPATLSGTVVTATAGALAGLCAEYITGDITTITGGTMTFDSGSDLWVFVGKDADNNTVGSFQVYQEDYQDAGFTFTGTPQDGDVVAFTCTIEEASSTYAWVRLDVQPVPTAEQIGAAVKTNKTATLAVADWSSNTQTVTVSGVTADNTVFVAPAPTSASDYSAAEILCVAQAANSLTFTCGTVPSNAISVNVVIID